MIDVLQAARNVLEAASADNAYISVIALPWEVRTYTLDEVIISALTGASMLDPRLEEIPRLIMIKTRHVVQIAYGFDLPQNLGLSMNFDWSAKVVPLILHIEYNWNFMGFQLIHIYKAAASLEYDAMFKGFTDVDYLGTDQRPVCDTSEFDGNLKLTRYNYRQLARQLESKTSYQLSLPSMFVHQVRPHLLAITSTSQTSVLSHSPEMHLPTPSMFCERRSKKSWETIHTPNCMTRSAPLSCLLWERLSMRNSWLNSIVISIRMVGMRSCDDAASGIVLVLVI